MLENFTSIWGNHFRYNENIFTEVDFKNYFNKSDIGNQERIHFLRGSLERHSKDGKYYFWNDYEKAILTHRILSRFGDDNDEIIMRSTFGIPWTISIELKMEHKFWLD